jgi:hypothetical protein
LDKEPFRQVLEIGSEDSIIVLLVAKDGEVLLSNEGGFEIEKD